MTRQYQTLRLNETRSYEQQVRKSERDFNASEQEALKYEQAKEMLRIQSIPSKTFAFYLGVSERFVQQMAGMDRKVPHYMVDRILQIGSKILWDQKKAIDTQIEDLMILQFGRVE